MNSLARALKQTEDVRDALTAETLAAQEERLWIRTLDIDELNQRALERNEFNRRIAGLHVALGVALDQVARDLGVPALTQQALESQAAPEGRLLAATLREVRALVVTLSEIDRLNRMLGTRALSYVRAHLAVLCPKPSAYDRHGGGAPDPRTSTIQQVL